MSSPSDRPSLLGVALRGGLAVGVLDGIAAVVSSALSGVSATRVFHYVASGVFGRDAFQGGLPMVAAGVGFHFITALGSAAAYALVARLLPGFVRRWVIAGVLWGVTVYAVMQLVVVPLSAAPGLRFSIEGMLRGLFIHVLCVGLPVAWIARRGVRETGPPA